MRRAVGRAGLRADAGSHSAAGIPGASCDDGGGGGMDLPELVLRSRTHGGELLRAADCFPPPRILGRSGAALRDRHSVRLGGIAPGAPRSAPSLAADVPAFAPSANAGTRARNRVGPLRQVIICTRASVIGALLCVAITNRRS